MTDLQIFCTLMLWLLATSIISYLVFRFGYNLGWDERHKSMILPRNVVSALNKRLDDNEQHDRHSAMDSKKTF